MENLTALEGAFPGLPDESHELVASFTVPGEPVSKSRARFTKRGSKMVSYTPQKTLDGERAMASAYREAAGSHDLDKEATFAVHAHFYNGTRQRRDVDNMVKLILDGLNEVAWPDDNQVTEIAARKSWGKKADARTVVSVYRIGEMRRPTQPCIRCGEPFLTYESWLTDPNAKKYCTQECAYKHRVEKKARVCKRCGADFQSWGEASETKYCSKECSYEDRRADTACAICNKAINIQRCHLKARNYCSDECRREQDRQAHKARKSKYFPGTCRVCGGGTTRKEYTRCNPCKLQGATGKPK